MLLQPTAPLSRDFVFGLPGEPVSLFSVSPQTRGLERREAPSGQPALRALPLGRHCDLPACTPSFPRLWGGGGPGACGPLRRARRLPALHRRRALSAAAPCSVIQRRDRRRPQLSKARALYAKMGERQNRTPLFARSFNTVRRHSLIHRRHARACRGHPRLGGKVRRGWPGQARP